uniref:Vesicle associated membrane protein 1 n=1 Tax=Salvator merianae TaxID=96440 RepID=A0A8D0C5M2_SALMN
MSDPAQPPAPGAGTEGGENAGGPPGPPPNLTSNRRLQQTQAQVEEVVDIMRVNVDKVLERDQKLSELDERADALQAGAQVFESSAAALKRKYWWKNCKMMIMLGVICAIVVIAIARSHSQVVFSGSIPGCKAKCSWPLWRHSNSFLYSGLDKYRLHCLYTAKAT